VPDSLRYTITGPDHHGYSYLVEFNMSARRRSKPIAVHADDAWGLQIVARDVDGDHDLDLIVTSGAHRRAVDVWLNDGQGGFTSAGVTTFPASIWIPEKALSAVAAVPFRDATAVLSDAWSAVLLPKRTADFACGSLAFRCSLGTPWADSQHLSNIGARAPPAA
jgi:hypothetical protein